MSWKPRPPGMKISLCVGRSAPPDSVSVDDGQAVLAGDLVGPQGLAHRDRVVGATAHRGVVGHDQALGAFDHADAGDDAGAHGEVGAPGGQRRQLEER